MKYGFSWYAMMNNDGTFASPRSSAKHGSSSHPNRETALANRKIFFVLAFQCVTGRAKSERRNLLASASAMQRTLHACLHQVDEVA
jgi:hypothetical protein